MSLKWDHHSFLNCSVIHKFKVGPPQFRVILPQLPSMVVSVLEMMSPPTYVKWPWNLRRICNPALPRPGCRVWTMNIAVFDLSYIGGHFKPLLETALALALAVFSNGIGVLRRDDMFCRRSVWSCRCPDDSKVFKSVIEMSILWNTYWKENYSSILEELTYFYTSIM